MEKAGEGSGTSKETASGRRNVTARVILAHGGETPRCYRFEEQCDACGEFRGKINVRGRKLWRPPSEHFDPERRAGRMPWFGYLVSCGRCQAAGRGPDVLMSTCWRIPPSP